MGLELEKLKTVTLLIGDMDVRYNHNHDSKGRFSSGGGGGGGTGRKYGKTNTQDAIDEINSGKHNSLEKYLDADGNLTDEREQLHKDIIDKNLEGKIPAEGQATMTMLGGGPASGKSSVLAVSDDDPRIVKVDPDKMKEELPGYSEMTKQTDKAASFYHEESSALAKRYSEVAYSENYDVLYDGTGDGSIGSVEKKIDSAKAQGYRVEGKYVTIDTEEAIRRNRKRYDDAVAEGKPARLPPEDMVRKTHAKVTDISVATAPKFDSIEIWDNNGGKGQQFKIATGGNGQYLKAVPGCEAAFDRYLAKGTKGLAGFTKLPDGQVIPANKGR